MYISSKFFCRAYDHILSESRGSSSSRTFILVAPDVDAICAAHLLHDMFAIDLVPNTVIPVASWSELQVVQERLQSEDVSFCDASHSATVTNLWYSLSLGAVIDPAEFGRVGRLVLVFYKYGSDNYDSCH